MKPTEDFEALEIGKQDEQGRRLAGETERRRLLEAFDASGLTQRLFARQEGINYFTFAGWLRQRRLSQVSAKTVPPKKQAFVEVGLNPSAAYALEVSLPGGVVVRGAYPAEVLALVKGLR